MSKKCARCDKTVYPLEELKCLEKIWHKACFKCQECGMILNMRNYKGFNRMPYCTAHCPQAKHTTVADTPEIRRIQENTKIQSAVKYHEEFEKQKGKVTQIADDPETLRIKQNTRIISNVAYHGDLEKKAIMEQRRPAGEEADDDRAVLDDEIAPPQPQMHNLKSPSSPQVPNQPIDAQVAHLQMSTNKVPVVQPVSQSTPSHIDEIQSQQHVKDSPYSARQASTVIYTSELGPAAKDNIYWGHGSTVIFCSGHEQVSAPQGRKIGSIADYDPINENYGSIATGGRRDINTGASAQFRGGDFNTSPQPQHVPHPMVQKSVGRTFKALYDYAAADADEITFMDGDVIVNCVPVDDGWMTGTVQRTGETGMLPANYVEPFN